MDALIEEENDYMGALSVLHPVLFEHILAQQRKLLRKIDTYELKMSIKKENGPQTQQSSTG